MKVILLQDVTNTGKQGDVVNVADGYARNYLFPHKVAVAAVGGALKSLEIRQNLELRRDDKIRKSAEVIKSTLEDKTITLKARSGAGKLYGRITAQDIADQIALEYGVKLDKRKISLDTPIKSVGDYEVPLKLHKDITLPVKVSVVAGSAA